MSAPVLSVKNLSAYVCKSGTKVGLVNDVSFDINKGETVAVVGESGSGKSVTALSIMRLLEENVVRAEGQVFLNQVDLLGLAESEMEVLRGNEIAMIFQEPMTSLNPVLTIERQIAEVLRRHRGMSSAEARLETIRLLERVRVPDASRRMRQYPHHFSGGMRQRVMIAMALACKPKLLIADEPTTALDVTIQSQILDLIKVLQTEEDMAVLFITHDMGVVAEIADRAIVMYRGNIVEAGTTSEVLLRPKHQYSRSLLAAVPRLGSMAQYDSPQRFPVVDSDKSIAREITVTHSGVDKDSAPVLSIRNLSTRFDIRAGLFGKVSGRIHAVANISFDLRAGETLSVVGESGCGKSTLARSILKLVSAQEGEIVLAGQDIANLSGTDLRQKRRNLQMVFQDPFASLNPRMTIRDAISEPLIINGAASKTQAHAVAERLLERVGLEPEMADRLPHEFSGGQRQRICIARALALEPKVVIADESVSALDVTVKAQIINLLLDLQHSLDLSYLFISHDMAVVERVSHRVAVMYQGEIVEIGDRKSIFGNPQHPYTRQLIAAVPLPDPARRWHQHGIAGSELLSPVRPADYTPPQREYRQVGDDHVVQVGEGRWEQSLERNVSRH